MMTTQWALGADSAQNSCADDEISTFLRSEYGRGTICTNVSPFHHENTEHRFFLTDIFEFTTNTAFFHRDQVSWSPVVALAVSARATTGFGRVTPTPCSFLK